MLCAPDHPLAHHSRDSRTQFCKYASSSYRAKMIEMANGVGDGARMKLLKSEVFTEGGEGGGARLPHSSEGRARDALELLEEHQKRQTALSPERDTSRAELVFLSHRWLRPAHPDTEDCVKAKALCEFIRYRKDWVRAVQGAEPGSAAAS